MPSHVVEHVCEVGSQACPAGQPALVTQEQMFAKHPWPVPHVVHEGPHALASLATHAPAHRCNEPGHPQVPPMHCAPVAQTWVGPADPHAPQLLVSVLVLTHVPLQSVRPLGQAHPPPWHVLPPVHVNCEPQPPQFVAFGWVFVASFTQAPLHRDRPGVVQVHWPALHWVPVGQM